LVALEAFSYRVRKYIGAYLAAMGGLEVLIFTGGIGQGSAGARSLALQGLQCMGIHLDEQRNRDARGFSEICRISTDDSPVTVLVVPTDEERMIARETLRSLSRTYLKEVVKTQQTVPFLLEVSAHHIHLSQDHVEALFGKGHQLTWHSDLSQPGQLWLYLYWLLALAAGGVGAFDSGELDARPQCVAPDRARRSVTER
jgi:acetate kinase